MQWVQEEHERGLRGGGERGGQSGRGGRCGQARAAEQGKNDLSASSTLSTPSPLSTASLPSTFAELAANSALALLAVACTLLDRQLGAQAKAFEQEGGFTERLYRVRSEKRAWNHSPGRQPKVRQPADN